MRPPECLGQLNQNGTGVPPDCLALDTQRQDAAYLRAVQLTEGKLRSVTVDSVTAPMLKLKKSKFQ